jgi:hypothetical protein
MLSNRRLRLQRSCAVIPLFLVALSSPAAGQSAAANPEVEDIVILRSLRLSRIEPTGFCAPTDPPRLHSAVDRHGQTREEAIRAVIEPLTCAAPDGSGDRGRPLVSANVSPTT